MIDIIRKGYTTLKKNMKNIVLFTLLYCIGSFSQLVSVQPNPMLPHAIHVNAMRLQNNPKLILQGKYHPKNRRYKTFACALQLMKQRSVKTIIETGTTRGADLKSIWGGDGGGTLLFAEWASKNNAFLYTVDICASAFDNAKKFLVPYQSYVQCVQSDSVAFLKQFEGTIDMLYLDSYDFDQNNPGPSQQHHLKEIIAAYPKLKKNSIVMIDDCDLPHGGKGLLAIQYLLSKGWKIVLQDYQVILVQE